MNDWRKLPKRPPGYAGPGRGIARQLGEGDLAWSRKTALDGARAVRKGEYLYITNPDQPLVPPVLWMDLFSTADSQEWLYGLPSTRRQRTTRRNPGGRISNTLIGTPGPYNLYVGDGHVLKLTLYRVGLIDPWRHYLAELIRSSTSGADMTVAYSEDQTPEDSIDHIFFADKQEAAGQFPRAQYAPAAAGAQIFASGYDASIDAYRFGVYGFYRAYDDAWGRFRGFVGDTKTRRLQEVTLPVPEFTVNRFDVTPLNIISHAPGKLFSLWMDRENSARLHGAVQISFKQYPEPLKAVRSSDHGQTWTVSDLPELTPHLLRLKYTEGSSSESFDDYLTSTPNMIGMHTASAVGGGRIALVMACANVPDTTIHPIPPEGLGGAYAPRATHWGFFVSDASGANFAKKAWPLDDHPGITVPWDTLASTSADYSGPLFNNPFGWAVGASTLTAGPGSFFIVVSTIDRSIPTTGPNRFPTDADLAGARMRVLWTVDYGDSWAFSDFLPETMRDAVPDGDAGRSYLPAVNFTVVRPYVDAQNPGLLVATVLRAGEGARAWRTDARFSAFTEVGVVAKDVSSTYSDVRSANQNALFVGSREVRASMRPGYPEYDRPQT